MTAHARPVHPPVPAPEPGTTVDRTVDSEVDSEFDSADGGAAAPAWSLEARNPLAKIAATVPAMIALVALRDLSRPATLLVLALVVLLLASVAPLRRRAAVVAGALVMVAVLSVSFGAWAGGAEHAQTATLLAVGPFRFTVGMLLAGFAAALRLTAIVALGLLAGLTSTGHDLARALVRTARMPYRLAYTAIAALQFVPRLRGELEHIRAARRVRGPVGRTAAARLGHRLFGHVVPLFAASIRHAERVALSMETRAFGAHPTRTERREVRWTAWDTLFVLAAWSVTAAVLVAPTALALLVSAA